MTNTCMASAEHKCRQMKLWQGLLLDTALQGLRLSGEPLVTPSQAQDLEINNLYGSGTLEAGLQGRAAPWWKVLEGRCA